MTPTPAKPVQNTPSRPPPPTDRPVSRTILAPRREAVLDRDPGDLAPFRLLPTVLTAPIAPTSAPSMARVELARAAEQLVTRLRVGRTREGALVELRLALGGRELDLRLVETPHGIELHTNDADDGLRRALASELAARGLAITIE